MPALENSELAQPTEGPAKSPRKIAIIGTAPQWQLAPFDDPSWEIWGIYGVACAGRRLTRLYELHDKSIIVPMAEKMYPDGKYWKVADGMGKNYITKDHYDQAPNAVRFDFQSNLKKYGPYFASSCSWLIADAINELEKDGFTGTELGIWGVNMSSDGEYAHQKPSCSYLLGWARAKGITVTIPASSELLALTHQYGLEAPPRFVQGMEQKRLEIMADLEAHKKNLKVSELGVYGAERQLDMLKYLEQNWKA